MEIHQKITEKPIPKVIETALILKELSTGMLWCSFICDENKAHPFLGIPKGVLKVHKHAILKSASEKYKYVSIPYGFEVTGVFLESPKFIALNPDDLKRIQ
jgi:hypothetical protein